MDETELRDLLPAERPLPAARRREMKERLMEHIGEEARTARGRYRVVAIAVAAAVLVAGGVVAVVAGRSDPNSTTTGQEGDAPAPSPDTAPPPTDPLAVPSDPLASTGLHPGPDPADAARVQELAFRGAGIESMGLQADMPNCAYPGGIPVVSVSEGTDMAEVLLDGLMTREALVQACVDTDYAHSIGGVDPAQASVCVREGEFPLAVVTLQGLACEDAGVGVTVRPMTDDDLARLNRLRAIEVSLLADPVDCRSHDEARQYFADGLAELGMDLPIEPDQFAGFAVEPCFTALLDWYIGGTGTVFLQAWGGYLPGPDGPFEPRPLADT